MAHIFGSIWDRFNRNALNDLSKSVEQQGKSIQDLVAEGQLTPEQYAELVSIVNGNVKKGSITTSDIDKNNFAVDQTMIADSLRNMITGDAPINAVPADGSITTAKIVNSAITAEKLKIGSVENARLGNLSISNEKIQHSAIKEHNLDSKSISVRTLQASAVTEDIIRDNAVSEIKLKNASVSTEKLKDSSVTNDKIMNNSVDALKISDNAITPEKTALFNTTNNLFDGKYQPYHLSGVKGSTSLIYNTSVNARTAIIPIKSGVTYSIKIHEPSKSNMFLLATHTGLPNFNTLGVANLTSLIEFNNVLKEYTFVADVTGYAYVYVSNKNEEPRMMFEEGANKTPYNSKYVIKNEYVNHIVDENETINSVGNKSYELEEKLKERELFPKVTQSEMVKTDPGARFIEYFDNKMWGYTFLNKDISYSNDEGKTWIVHTRLPADVGGPARLLPTDDGEVLLMSSTNIHKSIGWNSGSVTWTSGKVNKHANATLFQFSFDGDGKKFIVVEYANGTSQWKDSRYVWISTDNGNTFNVVWDSLDEHGEEINNLTHLHSACYDRWADRFYFTQGHSPGGGLYCSTDDGATWVQGKGHRDGVLASQGIVAKDGDTNGPTVVIATPTGLVMGSDNANNGMFGLVRKDNPEDEVVTRTYKADYDGAGVTMFAIRGHFDEASGTAYIAFRSELSNVPPIICAGTPTSANMIYEYPNLPVRGAEDHFGAIAKIGDDKLVAYAQFGGLPYTFRGNLTYPNTEIQVMVRNELKRLGII